MNQAATANLSRRLKRKTVSKAHSVRLDSSGEALLFQLQARFKGNGNHDIPAASVIFRRCLKVYGDRCIRMDAPALADERAMLIADTYLPVVQRAQETA
jgi:hypothetical protein